MLYVLLKLYLMCVQHSCAECCVSLNKLNWSSEIKNSQVINDFIVEAKHFSTRVSFVICDLSLIIYTCFDTSIKLSDTIFTRFLQFPSTYLIIFYLHWAMTKDLVLCAAGEVKHVKFSNFQIDSPSFEVSSAFGTL